MRRRQLVKTPTPHLDYNNTGEWSDPKEITKCEKCFKKGGKYGNRTFYCEVTGCTSEYEPGICSLDSLVAENLDQCKKPLYQKGFISEVQKEQTSGCKNDDDCGEGNICFLQNGIGEGGKLYKNRGVCKTKIKENYNSKKDKNYKTIHTNPNLNLINLLNDITTSNTWKITLNEIHNLTCQDIKDLIKLKVEESKKNGTYEDERNEILKSLNHINEHPQIINNTFNILETAIENVNCAIKEIHKEFEIENDNRVKVLTRTNNNINNDIKNTYDDEKNNIHTNNWSCSKNFKIVSLITIGILILIILYLYIKQKQFNNMYNIK